MATFRQEVEEMFCEALCPESDWENCKIKNSCALKKVTVDRICEAAKRMGERMPMTAVSARCQREADQYYIAKETEG